ncbi:hypothetical protein NDU88_002623 [Pleurodeles waltl]|uniref:Uncharacterized protein n=1 Tax=Pleurodeles waltl TaxID=8319 RepID=A0AAV7UB24_PLEWA|nr:hypothetical protein NDU88_002623 [Pleurodeles waltl]
MVMDSKVLEALALLQQAGRMDLVKEEALAPGCPARRASAGVAAAVAACSMLRLAGGAQFEPKPVTAACLALFLTNWDVTHKNACPNAARLQLYLVGSPSPFGKKKSQHHLREWSLAPPPLPVSRS